MAVTDNPLIGQYGFAHMPKKTGHPIEGGSTIGGWFPMKIEGIVGATKAWKVLDDNNNDWNITGNEKRGVLVKDEDTAKAIRTARRKALTKNKQRNIGRLDDLNMIFLDLKGVVRKVVFDDDDNVTFSNIEHELINEGVFFYMRHLIRAADNSEEEPNQKKKKKKNQKILPSAAVISLMRSVDDDEDSDDEEDQLPESGRKSGRGKKLPAAEDSDDDEDDDRVEELNNRREKKLIDQMKNKLEEREEELEYKEKELDDKEKELEEEKEDLVVEKNGLTDKQRELRNKTRDITTREDAVEQKEKDLEEEKEGLEERRVLQQRIKKLQNELQQQKQQSEQPPQQKQPPQQLSDEYDTNELPVLLPNDSAWQELTELARTDPKLCELLQKSIVSVDSTVDGEDMDIEDEMEEFATNGMVSDGLSRLLQIVKEQKYIYLQKYREQQMKQLEPLKEQLLGLDQNVLNTMERKRTYKAWLDNAPEEEQLTEDTKAKKLKASDDRIEEAETAYERAEEKMKTRFDKIAVDLEEKEVALNECTHYKKLEGESPEATKKSWKKDLRFESVKPSRLPMPVEESSNDNDNE